MCRHDADLLSGGVHGDRLLPLPQPLGILEGYPERLQGGALQVGVRVGERHLHRLAEGLTVRREPIGSPKTAWRGVFDWDDTDGSVARERPTRDRDGDTAIRRRQAAPGRPDCLGHAVARRTTHGRWWRRRAGGTCGGRGSDLIATVIPPSADDRLPPAGPIVLVTLSPVGLPTADGGGAVPAGPAGAESPADPGGTAVVADEPQAATSRSVARTGAIRRNTKYRDAASMASPRLAEQSPRDTSLVPGAERHSWTARAELASFGHPTPG